MVLRVALVSEHASPLAAIGAVDAGGQNVHVAELASGLVRLGHEVVVYCRPAEGERAADQPDTYRGMELVHLPAVRHRVLETLSHTAVSLMHRSIADADCAVGECSSEAPE